MIHRRAPLAVVALVSLTALGPAGWRPDRIQWEGAYGAALDRARDEGRVVFLAVNMDGEAANERMVEEVYRDRDLVALTEHAVNLVASADVHDRSGTCSRFGCTTCDGHREVDVRARELVLAPDGTGAVIAPQHVFLGPDGAVLLSVPYEVSSLELQWCFGEAWRLAGAADPPAVSPRARRPRRLIIGDVAHLGRGGSAPLTRDQVLELIDTHKKGGTNAERRDLLMSLVTADEPEARRYVLEQLRGGGGGGGGGLRGGGADRVEEQRAQLLRRIGEVSPPSYHEVVLPFVGAGIASTRSEAIVALEQLGHPGALPDLLKALRKEKDEQLEKDLLRAIGSCGADDRKAREALLRASEDRSRPLVRRNALIALGWLAPDDDVALRLRQAALPERFAGDARIGPDRVTPEEREAAVVAMGISRDPAWAELLGELRDYGEAPPELRDAATAAAEVLGGATYQVLRPALERAGSDAIPRDRLFPAARPRLRSR